MAKTLRRRTYTVARVFLWGGDRSPPSLPLSEIDPTVCFTIPYTEFVGLTYVAVTDV